MKKRVLAFVLVAAMLIGVMPMAFAAEEVTATLSTHKILVDGEETAFDVYNIDGANYFKLRDIAFVLNGTDKQFSVEWDEEAWAMFLVTGEEYEALGTEMEPAEGVTEKAATLSTQSVVLDEEEVDLLAYNIDGANYFQLRALGAAIDFGVEWDEESRSVMILSTEGYTEETEEEPTAEDYGLLFYMLDNEEYELDENDVFFAFEFTEDTELVSFDIKGVTVNGEEVETIFMKDDLLKEIQELLENDLLGTIFIIEDLDLTDLEEDIEIAFSLVLHFEDEADDIELVQPYVILAEAEAPAA